MAVYRTGRDLKNDVLFRASEPINGSSPWETKVMDYINRVYRTLTSGASEFVPEFVDDWWWMRKSDILIIDPVYDTGTVTVTQGSNTIVFSPAPASSQTGRRLRVGQHPDVFVIDAHIGGQVDANLDGPWTGESGAFSFKSMRTIYTLDTSVACIISPIVAFQGQTLINGMTPERMDELHPLAMLNPGVPRAFALEDDRNVRFSHGGLPDGRSMRVEYRFRPLVVDLIDSEMSIPVLPEQWRHVLADMALAYLLGDKNDDRVTITTQVSRAGGAAMLKENRRRNKKIDSISARIFPRQPPRGRRIDGGFLIDHET